MTARTPVELNAYADEFFPDNTTRRIKPVHLRTFGKDVADSLQGGDLPTLSLFAGDDPEHEVANTALLQSQMNEGRAFTTIPGDYRFYRGVTLVNGSGIVATPGTNFIMSAAGFNNTGTAPGRTLNTRYGPNAVLFLGEGTSSVPMTGITLSGFKITVEAHPDGFDGDNRALNVIALNAIQDCLVDKVIIEGVPQGSGLCIAACRENCIVRDVVIRDGGWGYLYTLALPNGTGILIDSDPIGDATNGGLTIINPHISDMIVSPAAQASLVSGSAVGYQMDMIQCLNYQSRYTLIGGLFENGGTAIDHLGLNSVFTGFQVRTMFNFGIAVKHSASKNRFSDFIITNAGRSGIDITANGPENDCKNNVFSNFSIFGVDPSILHGNNSAGISVNESGGFSASGNSFINGKIDVGNGWTGINDASASGQDFRGIDIIAPGGLATLAKDRYVIQTVFNPVSAATKSFVKATLSSTIAVAASPAAATPVIFDTEVSDSLGEYNPATGVYTRKIAGRVRVQAKVMITLSAAAKNALLICRLSGTVIDDAMASATAQDTAAHPYIDVVTDMAAGDTIAITCVHYDTGNRNIEIPVGYTWLLITDVG